LGCLGSVGGHPTNGRFRAGFRMPARRQRSTQYRGPASEAQRGEAGLTAQLSNWDDRTDWVSTQGGGPIQEADAVCH
jgi:hypothetical protein